MRVRYTPRARADLKEIDTYVRVRSLQGARNLRERMREAVRNLGHMPRTGRETDWQEIRIAPLVTYPYVIYYRIRDDEVHILHVRHGARQPPDQGDLTDS